MGTIPRAGRKEGRKRRRKEGKEEGRKQRGREAQREGTRKGRRKEGQKEGREGERKKGKVMADSWGHLFPAVFPREAFWLTGSRGWYLKLYVYLCLVVLFFNQELNSGLCTCWAGEGPSFESSQYLCDPESIIESLCFGFLTCGVGTFVFPASQGYRWHRVPEGIQVAAACGILPALGGSVVVQMKW